MNTETQSQEAMILQALQSGRKISPLDALNDYGCLRLGGRIFDLRAAGWPISDEWHETKSGKRVKRYWMPNATCKGNGHHNWSLTKDSCECGELKSDDATLEFETLKVPGGTTLEIGGQLRLIA